MGFVIMKRMTGCHDHGPMQGKGTDHCAELAQWRRAYYESNVAGNSISKTDGWFGMTGYRRVE